MTYTFTVYGRLPNLNDFIGAERTVINIKGDPKRKIFLTKGAVMKKQWQAYVVKAITRDLSGVKCKTPIKIGYHYFEPNRKRDKGNVHAFAQKVIEDALQDTKVIENDNWQGIDSFYVKFDVDAENPRIEVTLVEM